jgi:hypothetical protein
LFLVLFSLSVFLFDFPVSSSYVVGTLGLNSSSNRIADENFPEEGRSPFGGFLNRNDSNEAQAEEEFAAIEEKLTIESTFSDYSIEFTEKGKMKFINYLLDKGFFRDDAVTYTYNSEELSNMEDSIPQKFITAQNLAVFITDNPAVAQIYSGNDVDMGLNYVARDGDVQILIRVTKEDLETNLSLVEKTFSGLLYQGAHVATYAKNAGGRSPEE